MSHRFLTVLVEQWTQQTPSQQGFKWFLETSLMLTLIENFDLILFLFPASSSVAGAVGMTTSGESESDDSEMGRLQGTF